MLCRGFDSAHGASTQWFDRCFRHGLVQSRQKSRAIHAAALQTVKFLTAFHLQRHQQRWAAAVPRHTCRRSGLDFESACNISLYDSHRITNVRREIILQYRSSSAVGSPFAFGSITFRRPTNAADNNNGRSRGMFYGHRQQRQPERRAVSIIW